MLWPWNYAGFREFIGALKLVGPGRMLFQKNENLRTKIKLEYDIFRWARTTGVITLNCIQSKIAINTSNHT